MAGRYKNVKGEEVKNIIRIFLLLIILLSLFLPLGCGGATYVGVGISVPGAWGPYGGHGGTVVVGRPYYH